METLSREVTDKQKEACAVATMRRMIEKYSEKNEISFETAFFDFTKSNIYEALFDFSTNIWMEGPDYLMGLYEEALSE